MLRTLVAESRQAKCHSCGKVRLQLLDLVPDECLIAHASCLDSLGHHQIPFTAECPAARSCTYTSADPVLKEAGKKLTYETTKAMSEAGST